MWGTKKTTQLTVLGLAALIFTLSNSGPAAAECAPFPEIALWSELDHDFVRRQVEERYDGDWDAYLAKLERYQYRLKAIHDQGLRAGVTWRDKKVRLKGRELAEFLKLVEERLRVTQCLADNDAIADFSTAAGGDGGDLAAEPQDLSKCGLIPQVDWWKFKSHDKIVGFVNRRYRGDWATYIDTWSVRLKKLRDIYSRRSSAITSTGKVLKGAELRTYMVQMSMRIAVTRCLEKIHGLSNL